MRSSAFVCDGTSDPSVCVGLPLYKNWQSYRLCVLHFPGKKSLKLFENCADAKLDRDDFNFDGVWFPEELLLDYEDREFTNVVFSNCTFNGKVSFRNCVFHQKVKFSHTKFQDEVNFDRCEFREEVDFSRSSFEDYTEFSASDFKSSVTFADCNFVSWVNMAVGFEHRADFGGAVFEGEVEFSDSEFRGQAWFAGARFESAADFTETKVFAELDFYAATFVDAVRFGTPAWGGFCFAPDAELSFQHARIDHPERISFHTVELKPYWFLNVDSRKFVFTNVNWNSTSVAENLSPLDPPELLGIAYRNLAVNAEENHRYGEASTFRYLAMDTRRLTAGSPSSLHWLFRKVNRPRVWRIANRWWWGRVAFWKLSWWYWLASGYGERAFRAFIVLLCIWLLFAVSFTQVGFVVSDKNSLNDSDVMQSKYEAWGRPLSFARAVTYTGGVMTFQKPEPRPQTNTANGLVLLATLLGPLQAALLALAIRRKFIR
jgi:uncharacterized protein YjbI with pentapeptide repeats